MKPTLCFVFFFPWWGYTCDLQYVVITPANDFMPLCSPRNLLHKMQTGTKYMRCVPAARLSLSLSYLISESQLLYSATTTPPQMHKTGWYHRHFLKIKCIFLQINRQNIFFLFEQAQIEEFKGDLSKFIWHWILLS